MDKYERILFIDKMISSGDAPSQTDILDALRREDGGVDRTTLWRDMKDLEEKFHAPLDYVDRKGPTGKRRKGYIYTAPTFRVPAMFSSGDRIKSAQLMMRLLESVRGTPVYDEAMEVFKELGTEAPTVDSKGAMKFGLDAKERIIFIGNPCVEISPRTWKTVEAAVMKDRILKFRYRSKERTVAPYQLIFSKGSWNLWSHDYGSGTKRLYSLHLMEDVRFKSDKEREFSLPDDFDFRLVTPGFFGTFVSGETCEVRVRLRGYAAVYARDRTWGDGQSVEDAGGGWTRLSFTTTQFPTDGSANGGPILTWILGWGGDAVPEAPDELVEKWRASVSVMADNLRT